MTDTAPALLPCPFCGGSYLLRFPTMDGEWGYWSAYCSSCGADGPERKNKKDAIAAWNTRASGWRPTDAVRDDVCRILATVTGHDRVDGYADEIMAALAPPAPDAGQQEKGDGHE